MLKISESLIQFDESALGKTEEAIGESADRILRRYRSALEQKYPRSPRSGAASEDDLP
jgi:hypothetical protein